MGKSAETWCKVCTNKKKDGNRARKGCENRGLCLKFINSEEGKIWSQLNDTSNSKRKIDESPVLKQARKLVKGDGEVLDLKLPGQTTD